MLDDEIIALAENVNRRLLAVGHTMVTAESCTGGLIAGAITSISGSSAILYGGFVTYANDAKIAMIDVPAPMIESYGAVSAQVARAMAEGARRKAGVDLAVSVTGVAGPGGGSVEKPVGLVHFGLSMPAKTLDRTETFGDIGRDGVRKATVRVALKMILDAYAP